MDEEKIKQGVRLMLEGLGEDIDKNEDIKGTPQRVVRLLRNLLVGYQLEPKIFYNAEKEEEKELTKNRITLFSNKNKYNDLTIRKCKFYSYCKHHFPIAPFFGTVWVAIIPDKYLIGMNKIDYIVKYFAGKIQLQEDMEQQIADYLYKIIEPKGVMVIIEGIHMCAELQGDSGWYKNAGIRGVFENDDSAKEEVYQLIKLRSD